MNKINDLFRLGPLRFMWAKDRGDAYTPANMVFMSHLEAEHRRNGKLVKTHDLGSGLVTNIGVNLMANDFTWAAGATLKLMNYHAIGTGTTAAAASDFYLQTAINSGSLTGSTNRYMTGAQSIGGNASPNVYKTVATFTANAGLAVTEWVLAMSNAAEFTGRTSTGTSSSSLTDSGASFTTSGNGLQGWTVEINSSAINTPTTTVMGQVASNTGTALTLVEGWLTLANAAASTPGATSAYVVYPSIWDHKVFSAINLLAADTLQFQYSLTVTSGG